MIFVEDMGVDGSAVAVGALWVLAAAVTFALYQLFAKAVIGRMGAPLFTSIAMSAAGAAILLQFLATRSLAALWISPEALKLAILLAIGATVLPAYLMSAALSRISAAANATIGTLSPVVTLILAVLILDETVTRIDIVGTALVIAGVGFFTIADRRA